MMVQPIPVGVVFVVGDIPAMKCPHCLVTRELSRFWRVDAKNKPSAARVFRCTECL